MDTGRAAGQLTYAAALPELSIEWVADVPPAPRLIVLNEPLAAELGLDAECLREPAGIAWLTGQPADGEPTFAQAYAGHQFGNLVPRLGDGRALLRCELVDRAGARRDLHLKGSGRTPFARGGDGKAALGPMLREYIVSESLHALGIPTTRALAVIGTGEAVLREQGPLPGAILARVAASHLRVGTFQYAALTGDVELLRRLCDYAIARHYPHCATASNPYLDFYQEVVAAQAALLAQWMSVGFIHGVMNTDNMTISGESIDFGPCAFLDAYHPDTVFSSIDRGGRYAYANQPAIAQWNLARLAETLLPLLAEEPEMAVALATEVLLSFGSSYEAHLQQRFAAKLGLTRPDAGITTELLDLLATQQVDFTGFFRSLATGDAHQLFAEPAPFDSWLRKRDALLPPDRSGLTEQLNSTNPIYIPRNHVVEDVLASTRPDELTALTRLVAALRDPYEARDDWRDLAQPAPAGCPPHVTYCGT